jgi:hypothetical protein
MLDEINFGKVVNGFFCVVQHFEPKGKCDKSATQSAEVENISLSGVPPLRKSCPNKSSEPGTAPITHAIRLKDQKCVKRFSLFPAQLR